MWNRNSKQLYSVRRTAKALCYWCGVSFWKKDLTNDHVIPLGNNGPDTAANVVRACAPCNNERGQIVGAFCHCRNLGVEQPDRLKLIRRFMPSLIKARQLQAKWAEIELKRLGRSPSLDMLLSIPAVAKEAKHYGSNNYKAVLKRAREKAESRFKKEPSRDDIAVRAYFIWVESGYVHGRDHEHWLQAKRELEL